MKNVMTLAQHVISTEWVASQIAIGSTIAAQREPTEEYPVLQRAST